MSYDQLFSVRYVAEQRSEQLIREAAQERLTADSRATPLARRQRGHRSRRQWFRRRTAAPAAPPARMAAGR